MRLLNIILNVTGAMLFILALFIFGPAIETRFYPAFTKFTIINVAPAPNGLDTLMTVRFYKLRDCAPRGFSWYLGDLGDYIQQLNITSNRINPAPSRPVGFGIATFTVKDLIITSEDILRLHGEVYSSCWPFLGHSLGRVSLVH